MVVAAYGLILPEPVLDHPRHGCLNIHAPLLPRWRGRRSSSALLLAGDTETGIRVMRMDAGPDTGPSFRATRSRPAARIALASCTTGWLPSALRTSSRHWQWSRDGRLVATPQSEERNYAVRAKALDKEEARIVWTRGAEELVRQVRAFNPAPGAFTTTRRCRASKVWRCALWRRGAGCFTGANPHAREQAAGGVRQRRVHRARRKSSRRADGG
ncbi:MAG: hypothetical protein IPO58_25800 [Betaproteobacteria bacterium]|nr:hypothetical protein [Betaproteobacteria bacterium]